MKEFVLLSVVAFVTLVAFSSIASAKMVDVVHLKNGSIIRGIVTEIIPNEAVKIETANGNIFVYQFDEIDKMTKIGVGTVAKTVDVVHLKNGSIIQGMVTEIIPSETAKIETDDGSVFVYQFDEIQSITKKTEPIGKVTTSTGLPKRYLPYAVGLGCGSGCLSSYLPIPILGLGQVYNGEYTKALIFLGWGNCRI